MCRVYTKDGRQYVRLCYRFGSRRAEKVYFTGEPPLHQPADFRCHYKDPTPQPAARHTRRARVKNQEPLRFHVDEFVTQAEIEDMARYACRDRKKYDWAGRNVTLYLPPKATLVFRKMVLARAESFGWTLVENS